MAGGRLHWNNVAAPDFSAGFSGLRTASDLFNKSIDNGVAAVNSYINAKEESAARDLQAQIVEAGLNNDREAMAALMTNPLLKRVSTDKAKQAAQLGFNMLNDREKLDIARRESAMRNQLSARTLQEKQWDDQANALLYRYQQLGTINPIADKEIIANLLKGVSPQVAMRFNKLFTAAYGSPSFGPGSEKTYGGLEPDVETELLEEFRKNQTTAQLAKESAESNIRTVEKSTGLLGQQYFDNKEELAKYGTFTEKVAAVAKKLNADPDVLQEEVKYLMNYAKQHKKTLDEEQALAIIDSTKDYKIGGYIYNFLSGGKTGLGGKATYDQRSAEELSLSVSDSTAETARTNIKNAYVARDIIIQKQIAMQEAWQRYVDFMRVSGGKQNMDKNRLNTAEALLKQYRKHFNELNSYAKASQDAVEAQDKAALQRQLDQMKKNQEMLRRELEKASNS